MTSKNRKIAIGTSISVIVISLAYLLYRRSVNKKNSELMLQYIGELPKVNTIAAQNQIANQQTDAAITASSGTINNLLNKYKVNLVALDGKWYNLSNSTQRKQAFEIATNIATQLYYSIKGAGVDKIQFDRNFRRIGTNGAFILVNSIYKATFKEDLWAAIQGEEYLYKGAGNGWNAVMGVFMDLPNYDNVISTQAQVWNNLESKLQKK
jgi:hypothetical protein